MIHQLKTESGYFDDTVSGRKPFEVRKNDRGFKVGDFLGLNEAEPIVNPCGVICEYKPTGRCCLVRICYILNTPEYCKEGYVVLGIEPCAIASRRDNSMIYRDIPRDVPVYGGVEAQL